MLLAIEAANAAFLLIQTAITNGKQLHDVAVHAQTYFDSKSQIAKKADKSGSMSEIQAFLELQALRDLEVQLKELMIYVGRPGLYDDWLEFQAAASRGRKEAERQSFLKREKTKRQILNIFTVFCTGLVVIPAFMFIGYILLKFVL